MSTTPLHSEVSVTGKYTIVGGARLQRRGGAYRGLSVVIISRGGCFNRSEQFSDIEKLGAREIIAIERKSSSYDVEQLASRFSKVKFLLLHESLNPGQMINLGIKESNSSHVLVMWNNVRVQSLSDRMLQRVMDSESVCTAPQWKNEKSELIPSVFIPAFFRRTIRLVPAVPSRDGQASIFPYDYVGIYNSEAFLSIGGYDESMLHPHWQKMDFGMRAYLWGNSINCNASFRVTQITDSPAEDTTPDRDYLRFFLKNPAVRFTGDCAVLPRTVLLRLLLNRSVTIFDTVREFRRARKWVYTNRYRYRQDARRLLELWEEL